MAASANLGRVRRLSRRDPSVVKHEIRGDWSKTVLCRLDEGQAVYSDLGRFVWKTPNVIVETRVPARGVGDASRGKGLLGRALSAGAQVGRRTNSGASSSFPHFSGGGGSGLCAFAGALPGEMRLIELNDSLTWTVGLDSFVAAESTVGFGLRGDGRRTDQGPVLGRFAGPGSLFIAAAGKFIDLNPADYGGMIQADMRAVVAFDEGVTFTSQEIDASLSLATLRGEGKVILHS